MEDTYDEILKEKLGKKVYYEMELVKDMQCYKCSKRKKNSCRLVLEKSKCINFREVKK